ncbi:MAG: radical SAM protein [Candidatus Promineifilaceae bacterium]|nr:radical SAM protein [Candidatus Promineifilaceae bacterium]
MPPDITLVHPLFINKDPVEKRIMTPYFPLGLMYLAAVLREQDYRVDLFDCAFREDYAEFEAYMRRVRPPVVGLTSLITVRRHALILAEIAKKYGAVVILGGPDPSGVPERYLYYQARNGSYPVDMVVFDEGELTIVEVADYLFEQNETSGELRDIAGLRLRDGNGQVLATPPRPLIQDLDSIPFPARDLVDFEPYRRAWRQAHGYWSLSIINTRGCPYGCAWCQKAVFGRTYRSRSPENSAAEMHLLKETYRPDQLRVVDDITGIKRQWVSAWRAAVQARNAAIPFECLTRVNLAKEGMLSDLKAIGCRKIYFGAESGSQNVLDAMNKGARVSQLYEAATRCKRLEIAMYFFMMVGYPGEEWADLQLSVQMLRRTLPEDFSTTIAYPLPGTPFYEQMRDRLIFEAEWNLDWDYTAENKLLFQREKYNTFFYRLVIRWFHKEWEDAWLAAGRKVSPWRWARIKLGLWLYRAATRLLAHAPRAGSVRFQPAEGR